MVVVGVVFGTVVVEKAEVVFAGAVVEQSAIAIGAVAAVDAQAKLAGAKGAIARAQSQMGFVAGCAGADMHHAADGVATEAGGYRSAVDVDALYAGQRQVAEVYAAALCLVERYAVEKDQHLFGGGAPD